MLVEKKYVIPIALQTVSGFGYLKVVYPAGVITIMLVCFRV